MSEVADGGLVLEDEHDVEVREACEPEEQHCEAEEGEVEDHGPHLVLSHVGLCGLEGRDEVVRLRSLGLTLTAMLRYSYQKLAM